MNFTSKWIASTITSTQNYKWNVTAKNSHNEFIQIYRLYSILFVWYITKSINNFHFTDRTAVKVTLNQSIDKIQYFFCFVSSFCIWISFQWKWIRFCRSHFKSKTLLAINRMIIIFNEIPLNIWHIIKYFRVMLFVIHMSMYTTKYCIHQRYMLMHTCIVKSIPM